MPQISYRANLSAATFPLTVADAGRSVIIPGPDNNYDRRVDPKGEGGNPGIPQAIYMENVLPTPDGFQSVGFKPAGTQLVWGVNIDRIDGSCVLHDGTIILFARLGAGNLVYYRESTATVWSAVTVAGTYQRPGGTDDIDVGAVRGIHYLVLRSGPNAEVYTYSAGTLTNVTASVVGITVDGNLRLTSAFNYLVVNNNVAGLGSIAWSSTTTPLTFTPSLVSGAGVETPNASNTTPTKLLSHPNGFVIYTPSCVIMASYTGNARYPWKFREIANSGGYRGRSQMFGGFGNSQQHVGIDNTGKIQAIGPDAAENVLPEVSNFFERNATLDTFDRTTNVFSVATYTNDSDHRRVWMHLDRYIFVSYGSDSFGPYDYCLVYDVLLKRHGKLKITHDVVLASDKAIFFLNYADGQLWQLYFDIYDQTVNYAHTGVLVLGKFQLARSRHLQLEEVELESAQTSSLVTPNISLAVLPSLDGKNFDASFTPTLVSSSGSLRTYKCHKTAQNMTLVIKGAFNLNTVQLTFTPGGGR